MSVLGSKVLYILVLSFSVVLMVRSEKRRSSWNGPAVWAALLLGALLGLRHVSVGIDTVAYQEVFDALSDRYVTGVRGVDEPVFLWISWLLMQLGNSQLVFLFWGTVTNLLVMARLHQLKGRISIPVAMLAYFAGFYFQEFNVLRQIVAVAVVFYGTGFLESRKYWRYVACCLAAALIHTSAVLALGALPVMIWADWQSYSYRQRHFIRRIASPALAAAVGVGCIFIALYRHYLTLDMAGSGVGIVIPFKFLVFLYCIRIFRRVRPVWQEKCGYRVSPEYLLYQMAAALYGISLVLYFASYFIPYMNRVAYYFSIFELICYGYWYEKLPKGDVGRAAILAAAGLPLVLSFLQGAPGGQGEFPYAFFWMEI